MLLAAAPYRDAPMPELLPSSDLEVHEVWDADYMARLQRCHVVDIERRFAAGHRAYVAWSNEEPAAWGWVGTRATTVGARNVVLALADGERYLWDVDTLPAHRGRGIHPRLVEAIVEMELRHAAERWAHATGALSR